jgi:hypothetical protein
MCIAVTAFVRLAAPGSTRAFRSVWVPPPSSRPGPSRSRWPGPLQCGEVPTFRSRIAHNVRGHAPVAAICPRPRRGAYPAPQYCTCLSSSRSHSPAHTARPPPPYSTSRGCAPVAAVRPRPLRYSEAPRTPPPHCTWSRPIRIRCPAPTEEQGDVHPE